jgi:hypothetical protein
VERISELMVITVGHPAYAATTRASTMPMMIPAMPPIREMANDSITNWARMSLRVAPMARRTPISRVRSSTLASMMFMMPMPPTSREMPAIEPMTMLKILCVWRLCSSSASGTTTS